MPQSHLGVLVFSTSVEVFLLEDAVSTKTVKSSPRPWRCFPSRMHQSKIVSVFSTSVEVFPLRWELASSSSSLLHVRGGVSVIGLILFLIC